MVIFGHVEDYGYYIVESTIILSGNSPSPYLLLVVCLCSIN